MKSLRTVWVDLKSIWLARTEQERRLIFLIALVVAPLLFYGAVWAPLAARVAHYERVLPKKRAEFALMREQAIEARSLQAHQGHAPTGTSLLSFIEQKAQLAGISGSLSQLSPRGSHKAIAVFSEVPFNALARFIAGLGPQGVVASRVEMTPAGVGVVSGSVTLATRP